MAFALDMPAGWFDIPDSTFAAGAEVTEDQLVALNSLIRYGAVADEYLQAAAVKDGDTVQLAAGADDAYNYSRAEVVYAWSMQASPNPATSKNSGPGDLLSWNQFVDQDTGAAHTNVNYYVQGGDDTASTDGLMSVLLCCRRGAGNKIATATPGTGGGPAGGGGGAPSGGSGNPNGGPGDGLGGDQGDQGDGHHKAPRPVF